MQVLREIGPMYASADSSDTQRPDMLPIKLAALRTNAHIGRRVALCVSKSSQCSRAGHFLYGIVSARYVRQSEDHLTRSDTLWSANKCRKVN